jgi:hypothetical protein
VRKILWSPADIADHSRKNYSEISAQIRVDLREKRSFARKSVTIHKAQKAAPGVGTASIVRNRIVI